MIGMIARRPERSKHARPAEVQTALAEWELVEPGCWVRKLRAWSERDGG